VTDKEAEEVAEKFDQVYLVTKLCAHMAIVSDHSRQALGELQCMEQTPLIEALTKTLRGIAQDSYRLHEEAVELSAALKEAL